MDIESKYFMMFNELPPNITIMGSKNKVIVNMMEKAIERNKPISNKELNFALSEQMFDLVLPSDEELLAHGKKPEEKVDKLINKLGGRA